MIETRLAGLTVAIDVQHLYRPTHAGDEGAVFTDSSGAHTTEAHLSSIYAISMAAWFRARGASVITNDVKGAKLVGEYWTRNHQAAAWGANVYLACHVNAGAGRYAAVEYMRGSPGSSLALSVLKMLGACVPELTGSSPVALSRGQRGSVCISSFPLDRGAAVILEPFFGDCPQHRPLWAADRLQRVGVAIGEGVARWWSDCWRKPGGPGEPPQ